MALGHSLSLLLESTHNGHVAAQQLLDQADHAPRQTKRMLPPEARLLVAEKALQAKNVAAARRNLEKFMQSDPPPNQYLARGYYAFGKIIAAEASDLKAQDKLETLRNAASYIQRGIEIGVNLRDSHSFLVYNGSVFTWQILRPLLAQESVEAYSLVATFLQSALKSLTTCGETDSEWRLRLSIESARSLIGSHNAKEASLLLASCNNIVKECSDALQGVFFKQQTKAVLSDANALKKLRDEAAATPSRSALITSEILHSSTVPDAASQLLNAVEKLDPELGLAMRQEGSELERMHAVADLSGTVKHSGPLLQLAREGAQLGLLCEASLIAQRCSSVGEASLRLRSTLVQEMVCIARLDDAHIVYRDATAQGAKNRIASLRRLESIVSSARRVEDLELVEDACAQIWNTSQPLLQPTVLPKLIRSLDIASVALESVSSLCHEMRACIHLEIARAASIVDNSSLAMKHVSRGRAIDLPSQSSSCQSIERCLARMHVRLDLRTGNIFASRPALRAFAALDRLRSERKKTMRAQIIQDAANQLSKDGESSYSIDDAAMDVNLLNEHLFAWSEVMESAWSQRLLPVARTAALKLVESSLPAIDGAGPLPEVVRMQAEAKLTLGEIYIFEAEDAVQCQTKSNVDETSVTSSTQLRMKGYNLFCDVMKHGAELKDTALVMDGACLMLNSMIHMLRGDCDLIPLIPMLRDAIISLRNISMEEVKGDPEKMHLLFSFVTAFSRAIEVTATICAPEDGSSKGRRTLKSNDTKVTELVKEAVEACKWIIESLHYRHSSRKSVIMVWARLQSYLGAKDPEVGSDPVDGALARLGLLSVSLVDGQAAKSTLDKVISLLECLASDRKREEVELWARTAHEALGLDEVAITETAYKSCLACYQKMDSDDVKSKEGRWLALAELSQAVALGRLVDAEQPAELCVQLHAKALIHLSSSTALAVQALDYSLIRRIATESVVHTKPLRLHGDLLLYPAQKILELLLDLPEKERQPIESSIVEICKIMLTALATGEKWSDGLELLEGALRKISPSSRGSLWEEKIRFMCRAGSRGIAGEMWRVKDLPYADQCRIWGVVGLTCSDRNLRLLAHMRAVEVARKDSPIESVEWILRLADYLFKDGFPLVDAKDQLLAAMDTILDECKTPTTKDASSHSSQEPEADGARNDSNLNLRQLEQLMRLQLMAARMENKFESRRKHLVMCHYYLQKLWRSMLETTETADTFPRELHEWAGWQTSTELIEQIRAACARGGQAADRVISRSSIPHPETTVAYLELAIEMMNSAGLLLHTFLPIHTLEVIAVIIMESEDLERVSQLRRLALTNAVGLRQNEAEKHLSIWPSAELKRKAQMDSKKLINTIDTPHDMESPLPRKIFDSNFEYQMPNLPTTLPPSNSQHSFASAQQRAGRPQMALWVDVASLLLDDGQIRAAAEWLAIATPLLEGTVGASGVQYPLYLSRCRCQLARLAMKRGEFVKAEKLLRLALQHPLEADEWAQAVVALSLIQRQAGQRIDAINTLTAAANVVEDSCEYWRADAQLTLALADLKAVERVRDDDTHGTTSDGLQSYRRAAELLRVNGDYVGAANILLKSGYAGGRNLETAQADFLSLDADFSMTLNTLEAMQRAFTGAIAMSEKALRVSTTHQLPARFSLPQSRIWKRANVGISRVHLLLENLRNRMAQAMPLQIPVYPMVDGRDGDVVSKYLTEGAHRADDELDDTSRAILHDECAFLHGSAALSLSSVDSLCVKSDSLACVGEALLSLAEKHGRPRTRFSPAILTFTDMAAKNVPDCDLSQNSGTSDAYIKLELLTEVDGEYPQDQKSNTTVAQSDVIPNTTDPRWEAPLSLPGVSASKRLRVGIWDNDESKDDDMIASAEIDVPSKFAGTLDITLKGQSDVPFTCKYSFGHGLDIVLPPINSDVEEAEDSNEAKQSSFAHTWEAQVREGKEKLEESIKTSIRVYDSHSISRSAMVLAQFTGAMRTEECVRWLAVAQCHSVRKRWLSYCQEVLAKGSLYSLLLGELDCLIDSVPQAHDMPVWKSATELLDNPLSDVVDVSGEGATLAGFHLWQMLDVPSDPLGEVLQMLSPSSRIIQISLNVQRGEMFAYIARGKENAQSSHSNPNTDFRVATSTFSREKLDEMQKAFAQAHRLHANAALARCKANLGFQPISSVDFSDESKAAENDEAAPQEQSASEQAMQKAVAKLEDFFHPILAPLVPLLAPHVVPSTTTSSKTGSSKSQAAAVASGTSIFLISDERFWPLPLELLPPFQSPHISGVARDISTAVLLNRLKRHKSDQKLDPTKVTCLVDLQNKVEIPPSSADDKSRSLGKAFREDILSVEKHGEKWTSIIGSESGYPSADSLVRTVHSASCIIYHGAESLLSSIHAGKLLEHSLTACAGCFIFDRHILTHDADFGTSSPIDPFIAASLLSLCGVRVVAFPLWGCVPDQCHAVTAAFTREFFAGKPLLDIVRSFKDTYDLGVPLIAFGLPTVQL